MREHVPTILGKVRAAAGKETAARLLKSLKTAIGNGSNQYKQKGGADKAKSQAARQSYKAVTPEMRAKAAQSEKEIARMIGGKVTEDFQHNHTVDVIAQYGQRLLGVEMKTVTVGENDKITMHPDSKEKKEAWGAGRGKDDAVGIGAGAKRELHTVVVDKRNGGNKIYYKQGVGSYRLGSMTPVKNGSHLKELMGLK